MIWLLILVFAFVMGLLQIPIWLMYGVLAVTVNFSWKANPI